MSILLDTQAIIWYVIDESLLSKKAIDAVRNADIAYVSAISFYEIAIKLAKGGEVGINLSLSDIIKTILESGFIWLPLSADHIEAYLSIPLVANHKDPFDRILLATAYADDLTIVSSDHNFPLYDHLVTTIW